MTELPASQAVAAPVESGPSRRTIDAFVRLWAVAHLIHLCASTNSQLDTPWNVAVVVAALALLLRPRSGTWFVVLAVAQLADMVWELPLSPDHWMLIAFVNLAILATMALRRSTNHAALAAALPAARTIVLIAYSAAAIAKYNTSFLDPASSCAGAIANTASFGLTGKLDVGPLWVVMVLIMETSIPVLLAIPATRRHGVRIAIAFHFMLSASPAFAVVDFTAALVALFFLFLADRDADNVLDFIDRVAARSAIVRDARRKPWLTATLAFLVFGLLGYLSPRVAAGVVFVASELFLFGVMLAVLWTWRASRGTRAFGRLLWVHVPVLILLVLWISSPYLGLRTTGVFTMFSGIRTEGSAPNHVFMPTVRLTSWQDEFVVIDSTNSPDMTTAHDGKLGIPLIALRRLAMDDPDLVVTGRINGRPVVYGPGPGQRRLEPLHGLEYKLLLFRPVAVNEQRFCTIS